MGRGGGDTAMQKMLLPTSVVDRTRPPEILKVKVKAKLSVYLTKYQTMKTYPALN
jgi:hypothetical protein